LKAELAKYKYPDRKVGEDKNQGENPMDKHNHLPDALRYLMAPLPQFPDSPDNFNVVWQETMLTVQASQLPFELTSEIPSDFVGSFMDNFG
jgi:hypothetical protein